MRGDDEEKFNAIIQGIQLPPIRGEEFSFLPVQSGEDEGFLLPIEEEKKIASQPSQEVEAANMDLLKFLQEAPLDWQKQLQQIREDVGVLPPRIGGDIPNERNIHIWYACAIQIHMQDAVHYALQQLHCTFVHAINAWLMPFPRPSSQNKR